MRLTLLVKISVDYVKEKPLNKKQKLTTQSFLKLIKPIAESRHDVGIAQKKPSPLCLR